MIKDADEHLQFSFITGVSKFSKVSLFSGVNNLLDITLDPENATLCGYTEEDLDQVFGPELEGLDRSSVRNWYNGYCWRGDRRVYNPFDILLLFKHREFNPWWFETGTPTFLVDILTSRGVPSLSLSLSLDSMIAGSALLSTFDVDDMATEALLFQTGYLTITGEENHDDTRFYRLGHPNREVRQGLNESLLAWMVKNQSRREANRARLLPLLLTADFQGLEALIGAFFASIPSEWLSNNAIANYEGYYASVFYWGLYRKVDKINLSILFYALPAATGWIQVSTSRRVSGCSGQFPPDLCSDHCVLRCLMLIAAFRSRQRHKPQIAHSKTLIFRVRSGCFQPHLEQSFDVLCGATRSTQPPALTAL